MEDDLTTKLRAMKANLPSARPNLSEAEKDELVARVGPKTAKDIIKATADFPLGRIPFIFSSVDSQAVIDLLANDMTVAIAKALTKKKNKK